MFVLIMGIRYYVQYTRLLVRSKYCFENTLELYLYFQGVIFCCQVRVTAILDMYSSSRHAKIANMIKLIDTIREYIIIQTNLLNSE